MQITLDTPTRLAELLAHLRDHGCIAFLDEEGRCVHAVPPTGTPLQEEHATLRTIVNRWAETRGATFALRD